MAVELNEDYAYRHNIVDELFIKTADENYITARWCAAQGLDVDFFWLGVHAVEKYLKAALLLNGRSAKNYKVRTRQKNYGHDIVKLYAEVQPLAPELLASDLQRPPEIDGVGWYEEPTEKFIERLLRMGHADNRYLVSGYFRHPEDSFKLDQVVFAVRRLCQPLEAHFLGKKRQGTPDQSRRERMLKDHPVSARLGSRLEEIMEGRRGKELQRVALNCNFPFAVFAPKDFKHAGMRYGMSGVNPVLVRRIIDPLKAMDSAREAQADQLWKWVRDNIQLPKALIDAYEEERERRKRDARAR